MAKESGKKSFLDYFKVKNIEDEDEFDDDLFDDDDDYDDYDDYDDDYVKPKKKKAPMQQKPSPAARQSAATQQSRPQSQEYVLNKQPQSGKLVNFKDAKEQSVARPDLRGAKNNEVYVIKPHETDEAQYIIDLLIQKRTVVVNIEGLEINTAQRIIDYIGGACYAMGGSLSGISANIFIATPHEVEVSGDLRDEIVSQDSLTPYTQY